MTCLWYFQPCVLAFQKLQAQFITSWQKSCHLFLILQKVPWKYTNLSLFWWTNFENLSNYGNFFLITLVVIWNICLIFTQNLPNCKMQMLAALWEVNLHDANIQCALFSNSDARQFASLPNLHEIWIRLIMLDVVCTIKLKWGFIDSLRLCKHFGTTFVWHALL